jgi:hypothetical protein
LLLQHLLLDLGGQFPPKCPGQFPPKRVVSLRRNGVVTFIRISMLETKFVEDEYFDLTGMFGNRAKLQSAYVLYGTPALNLKSAEFSNQYRTTWHQFTLTQQDKNLYLNPKLLHPAGDEVIPHILDWYNTHIQANKEISDPVKAYFEKIISYLR